MADSELTALALRIRNALGCSKILSEDYAKGISATPEIVHGKILVRNEDGRVIAYVPESVLKE